MCCAKGINRKQLMRADEVVVCIVCIRDDVRRIRRHNIKGMKMNLWLLAFVEPEDLNTLHTSLTKNVNCRR